MSTTATIKAEHWQSFTPISLDGLNAKSAMLTRRDNKYILNESLVQVLIPHLAEHFDILEIDRRRLFHYESCYFDDDNFRCYFDHHQGRRQRIKVRTRRYVDSNVCFFEIKLKDARGMTIKHRMPYPEALFTQLNPDAMTYIQHQHQHLYGTTFSNHLKPTLHMGYLRTTLVAKQGGERVTLDHGIYFKQNQGDVHTARSTFILEAKSKNGNGIADSILRKWHQHPNNNCSKYCIGLCVTGQVEKFNVFMPTLRKLGLIDLPSRRLT